MNRIGLLVAVCLVFSVCINMTTCEKSVAEVFHLFDVNNDQVVDIDEVNMFGSRYFKMDDLIDYGYSQADENADGLITLEEFETVYDIIVPLKYLK